MVLSQGHHRATLASVDGVIGPSIKVDFRPWVTVSNVSALVLPSFLSLFFAILFEDSINICFLLAPLFVPRSS